MERLSPPPLMENMKKKNGLLKKNKKSKKQNLPCKEKELYKSCNESKICKKDVEFVKTKLQKSIFDR
jgi:hypothetical protein